MDAIKDKPPQIEQNKARLEEAIVRLRQGFEGNPRLQDGILATLDGLNGLIATPLDTQPIPNPPKKDEEPHTPTTLEQSLSGMYSDENYELLVAQPRVRRGSAAVGVSNEQFYPEDLKVDPPPDGYIIGTGNGAIWSMLELFKNGAPPKGIISLDFDPSVVLSGKVLIELANRNLSREEAISYLYGDLILRPSGHGNYYHPHEELVAIARSVAEKEQNPKLRQILLDQIENGTFIKDTQFMITRHHGDYKEPIFDQVNDAGKMKGRINTSGIVFKHWDTIKKLVHEGKVFIGYANLGNNNVLDFIEKTVPDIRDSRNILYTSNVVDIAYSQHLNGLERFNPNGESSYVYTTSRKDNYKLKTTHTPPPPPTF